MKPQSWLSPFTPLYAVAIHAKNLAYHRHLLRPGKLQGPVISIGNLSTGGSGKTPFVIALANLLTSAGLPVDVLSRGYSRTGHAIERVDPGPQSTAQQYGDEPLLIARSTNVPVYVAPSRHAAGILAEHTASAKTIHLLDDAFQHRRLARDLDVILLRPSDLTGHLLPAGHLREPLSSISRAHVVVLREEDSHLEQQIRQHMPMGLIWHIRRQLLIPPGDGPVVAFTGIAHPEEFFANLRENQVELATTIPFPDHHAFTEADLTHLITQAKQSRATRFLTTEKDHTRLNPAALARLQACAPVATARLHLAIVEADAALNLIRSL